MDFKDIIKRIDSDLPTNNKQEITANTLRGVLKEMVYASEESVDFLEEGSEGQILTKTKSGVEWKNAGTFEGEQGLQGKQGERGIQGEQGLQGKQGERGIQGEQGLQGKQGERGIQGEQGPQGKQGQKGDKGDDVDSSVLDKINGDIKGLQTELNSLDNIVDSLQDDVYEHDEAIKGIQNQIKGIQASDLNLENGTGENAVQMKGCQAIGDGSFAIGKDCTTTGKFASSFGQGNQSDGQMSVVFGEGNETHAFYEFVCGPYATKTDNEEPVMDEWRGHSETSVFKVGNGSGIGVETHYPIRHDALDIRQDGTIYISDVNAEGTWYEKPMINLQETIKELKENGGSGDDSPIKQGQTETSIIYKRDLPQSAQGNYSVALGFLTQAQKDYTTVFGIDNAASNECQTIIGRTATVDAGFDWDPSNNGFAALFNIGNGFESQKHDAFKVTQDGRIYIADTTAEGEYYEKPMINLQETIKELKENGGGGTSDLNIENGTGINSLKQKGNSASANFSISMGSGSCIASGEYSITSGYHSIARGKSSFALGEETRAEAVYSYSRGNNTKANGQYSHAEGFYSEANGNYSHAEGFRSQTKGYGEYAIGYCNSSISTDSSNFTGSKEDTLFTIGNGSGIDTRHNAFEVRQDGTILIPDVNSEGNYWEKPMINLQETIKELKENGGGTVPDKWVKSVMQEGGYIRVANSSGTVDEINFKTINGQSIFGTSDIKIGGGDSVFERGDGENAVQAKGCRAIGEASFAIGRNCTAQGMGTFAVNQSGAHSDFAAGFGLNTSADGYASAVFGEGNETHGKYEFVIGSHAINTNYVETGWTGSAEVSVFKIGNGYWDRDHHNAVDIRQNGDFYFADTNADGDYDKKPMLKLQDVVQKKWVGTWDEYTNIESHDQDTIYYIIEE